MKKLTKNQQAVLVFVMDQIRENHRPPTSKEIADHFGWKSPNASADVLKSLERKKQIKLNFGNRGIKVLGWNLKWHWGP